MCEREARRQQFQAGKGIVLSEQHRREIARAYANWTYVSMRLHGADIYELDTPEAKETIGALEELAFKSLTERILS